MAPFPLPLTELFGHWGAYGVYLLIGIAFGWVLEVAGFGNSSKLAKQFYFKDLTVLKVMFGAIVVAMVLVFLAVGIGVLDYNLIWVNPTYLWPGIVGGLIMGVGFIVGGFCPGTSLVAAATAKIDGIFFVLGVFFGIFLFGETASYIEDFWYSSYMGRFTIQDFLGVDAGVVVLGVVIMAFAAFWAAEQAERIIGGKDPKTQGSWRYGAAGAIVLVGVIVLVIGQPTTEEKWARAEAERGPQLAERQVQIHPGEMLDLLHDARIKLVMVDVRDEADYNVFHIMDSENIPVEQLGDEVSAFHLEPANTVFVVMSNDETAATEAWRTMIAESVPNVYILENGINGWIETFSPEEFLEEHPRNDAMEDQLAFTFSSALGDRYVSSQPNPEYFELEYESKVVLEVKRGPSSGGCG